MPGAVCIIHPYKHSNSNGVFLRRVVLRECVWERVRHVPQLCYAVRYSDVDLLLKKVIVPFFQIRLPLYFFSPTPWPIRASIHVQPPVH